MSKKYVQTNTLYLAGSGVIVAATSITLTTFTDIYGNVLTMTDFGDVGYITLEPDTTNEEGATFTGVTANANSTYTLTGVKTILAKSPYTQTSGLIRSHSGGTKVVVTDNVAFWDTFANKNNTESILGKWTFDDAQRPTLDADTDTAVATDFISFGQLSRQAIAGAANASTTVKGLVELATQAEVDARTTTGGTGAALVPTPDTQRSTLLSDYKADTGAANAYVITPVPAITAYAAGQIFSFKATNANTTTSTLNVSGLGVKTIKKLGGSTDLVAADIVAGQIVQVEYDGTNFQMLNPTGTALPTNSLLYSLLAAESISTGNPLSAYYYQADGGVTFDAKQGTSTGGTGGISVSFTVGNNANRTLVIFIHTVNGADFTGVLSYAGVAMTRTQTVTGASFERFSVFTLIAPATGANNITFNNTSTQYCMTAYSYYNTNQSSLDNSMISTATSQTITATTQGVLEVSGLCGSSGSGTATLNMLSNTLAVTDGGSGAIKGGDSGQIIGPLSVVVGGTSATYIASVGLTPVTAVSFGYVAKTTAVSTTNTAQANKYSNFVGFATNSASATGSVVVQTDGVVTGLSGLVALSTYYLSDTSATLSTTAGTNSKKIGVALTSTTLLIRQDN